MNSARPPADDDDDVLDIDIEDLQADGEPAGVLDLTLEEQPPASSSIRPSEPPVVTPQGQPALPMTSSGSCPQCGYALRPLEDVCPRCHFNTRARAEAPAKDRPLQTEPAPVTETYPPPLAPAPRRSGCGLGYVMALGLLFLALLGIPMFIWMQPAQRARREYQAGLREQLRGHFEAAREHYRTALHLDPKMGLAALTMGTTYLRIGDPTMIQSIQELSRQAMWGQTQDLDEADRWFRQAIQIGQELPPDTHLADQRITNPPRLRAFAHACLGVTAAIRASAALQADQLDDGMAWFQVATQEAQNALMDDPGNPAAEQVLRATTPHQ